LPMKCTCLHDWMGPLQGNAMGYVK
jgi:hypothetical protein